MPLGCPVLHYCHHRQREKSTDEKDLAASSCHTCRLAACHNGIPGPYLGHFGQGKCEDTSHMKILYLSSNAHCAIYLLHVLFVSASGSILSKQL